MALTVSHSPETIHALGARAFGPYKVLGITFDHRGAVCSRTLTGCTGQPGSQAASPSAARRPSVPPQAPGNALQAGILVALRTLKPRIRATERFKGVFAFFFLLWVSAVGSVDVDQPASLTHKPAQSYVWGG